MIREKKAWQSFYELVRSKSSPVCTPSFVKYTHKENPRKSCSHKSPVFVTTTIDWCPLEPCLTSQLNFSDPWLLQWPVLCRCNWTEFCLSCTGRLSPAAQGFGACLLGRSQALSQQPRGLCEPGPASEWTPHRKSLKPWGSETGGEMLSFQLLAENSALLLGGSQRQCTPGAHGGE